MGLGNIGRGARDDVEDEPVSELLEVLHAAQLVDDPQAVEAEHPLGRRPDAQHHEHVLVALAYGGEDEVLRRHGRLLDARAVDLEGGTRSGVEPERNGRREGLVAHGELEADDLGRRPLPVGRDPADRLDSPDDQVAIGHVAEGRQHQRHLDAGRQRARSLDGVRRGCADLEGVACDGALLASAAGGEQGGDGQPRKELQHLSLHVKMSCALDAWSLIGSIQFSSHRGVDLHVIFVIVE